MKSPRTVTFRDWAKPLYHLRVINCRLVSLLPGFVTYFVNLFSSLRLHRLLINLVLVHDFTLHGVLFNKISVLDLL